MDILNSSEQENYWNDRYESGQSGWNIGAPSDPIREYLDQLEDKELRILFPGAGNGYEAEYAWAKGFRNTYVLDLAPIPLKQLSERMPAFPEPHLIHDNFFHHEGTYDLVIEQTFFCSFPPTKENREAYGRKMAELIAPGGKLVGLWFNFPLAEGVDKRPFGGSREEYLGYLEPYFEVRTFGPAYNSIAPRAGKELFGIFVRRGA